MCTQNHPALTTLLTALGAVVLFGCDGIEDSHSHEVLQPAEVAAAAHDCADLQNDFSVALDGVNDRLELPDEAIAEPTDRLSMFMRIAPNHQGSTRVLLSKWRTTPASRSFVLDLAHSGSGRSDVRLVLCTTPTSCSFSCSTPLGALPEGGTPNDIKPTSVGASVNFAERRCRIYVDGAEQTALADAGAWPAAWVDSDAEWTVGGRTDSESTRDFDGRVDDIIIDTDAEWSADQFHALHNLRASTELPPELTVETWCRGGDDDDGIGTVCSDHSENLADWTLENDATFGSTPFEKLQPAVASSANLERQVVVWLGQSNASGVNVDPATYFGVCQDDEFPHRSRVYVYPNDGGPPRIAEEPMDSNVGQASSDCCNASADQTPQVSPMLSFGNELAAAWPSHEIGIVPAMLGGSEVGGADGTWNNWNVANGQSNRLFGEAVQRALDAVSPDAEILAFVIYQGEGDAGVLEDARSWDYRWEAIVHALRDRFGDHSIPAVVVQLPEQSPTYNPTGWSDVRLGQAAFAARVPHSVLVQHVPTGYDPGLLHIDADSQMELGRLTADALLSTEKAQLVLP